MSPRELLLKEIEQMPDAIVQALLDFLMLLKPSVQGDRSLGETAVEGDSHAAVPQASNMNAAPGQPLVDLFLSAPLGDKDLILSRDKTTARDVFTP